MKKRIIALFVTITMILSMSINVLAVTNHTVDEAMSWLDGLEWTKVGSGQCVALIDSYYSYLGVSPVSGNACDYATNELPSDWKRVKGGVPQKGDVLVYTGAKYGHVAIYAGGTVSYHQNMAGKYVEKKTSWNYDKSWYSETEGGTKSYWGYIRPNWKNNSSYTPVTPSYNKDNTSLPTPLVCYTVNGSQMMVSYGSIDSFSKGTIGAQVQCTITAIYTNGYCAVEFAGMQNSMKAYAPLSAFAMGTRKTRDARVTKKETVYRRSNLAESIGTVSVSDSIQIIYENGSVAQIIYPLDAGGFKMGWISLSKLAGYSANTTPSGNTNYAPVNSPVHLPIKAYTKSSGRVTTYSSVNGTSTGWIDGAKDLCTIHEVYGNGWVKVSYPTSKGSKTAYTQASNFADSFSVRQTTIATSNTTVCRRTDMSSSLGTIYSGDELQIVGSSGGLIQVVYPIQGAYKMGWIGALATRRTLENVNTVQKPNQQTYVAGQKLNTSGMGVNAQYTGGFFRTLARKLGLMEDGSDGYDLKNTQFNTVGTNTVAVVYEENGIMKTDSFNVEVIPRAMTSISVTTLPKKTAYIEEQPFIKDGMVVTATFNDGTTEILNNYELILPDMVPGTQTVYVEAEGMGTSFDISVRKKVLQEIKIKNVPNKTTYIEGQQLDTTGLVIEGYFDNDTTENFTENYTCQPSVLNTVGKQNVVVAYKGKQTIFAVDVIQKVPVGIDIISLPNENEIVEGTIDLDISGLAVNVEYNDGTIEALQGGYNVYGYDARNVGKQEITVNYCGFTDVFEIDVKAKQLTKIEIAEPAYITEFIEGEDFNSFGLVIYGHYDNGDVNEIYDYTLSGYDTTVGTKTITVTAGSKSTSYDVVVSAKSLECIDVEELPIKTEYLEDEELDITGLSVVAVYNNGDRETIALSDLKITGYNNTPGIKGINVSYNDYSTVFDVIVKAMTLTSFTLNAKPLKTEYNVGEELDLTGLSMTAKYEHGYTETVNIDNCTISGFNKDKSGIQIVIISYRGSNVAFVVNVKQIVEQTAMIRTKNVSAVNGSTIAVPVNIINNTGISNLELNISYDKTILTNADIKASELLSGGTFNVSVSEETDDFIIQTITWSADNDMAKNGTIFTVYFAVDGDAASGSYPIEVTYNEKTTLNKDGKAVKLSCVDGCVDVAEGETIPYVISCEQATVQSGGLLNYEISLANNVGLSSYKLQVLYDTSVLDINAVKSGRLFGDFTVDYTEIDGGIEITGASEGLNKQNGSFLSLEFTAAEGIENATYPISVVCTENGNDATIECEEGSVAISGYVLGDINGDGRVNNFDVMMHIGYLNGNHLFTNNQLMAADVTGDGSVDYLDYSSLSSYVVGIYESINSDIETIGSSLSYASNFVGGANSERAVITASEIFDAQPGEYVMVDVDLSRNPGLSGYVVTLEYDTESLELIDIVQKNALSGGKFNTNTSVEGEATVMWSDIETHNDNGTIFSVTFKVGKNVPEELPLILTYNSEHTGYLDETYTSVPVTLMSEDGAIYVDTTSAYMTIDDVVSDGTNISGVVNIYNGAEFTGTADLFIAAYDDTGKLISIESQEVELEENKTAHSNILICAKDAKILKVFVFNKGILRPLVKSQLAKF